MTGHISSYGSARPAHLAHLRRAAASAGEAFAPEADGIVPVSGVAATWAAASALRIALGIGCGLVAFAAIVPFFMG